MIFTYEIKDTHVETLAGILITGGATLEEQTANLQAYFKKQIDDVYNRAIEQYVANDPAIVAARESLATLVNQKTTEEKPINIVK